MSHILSDIAPGPKTTGPGRTSPTTPGPLDDAATSWLVYAVGAALVLAVIVVVILLVRRRARA